MRLLKTLAVVPHVWYHTLACVPAYASAPPGKSACVIHIISPKYVWVAQ